MARTLRLKVCLPHRQGGRKFMNREGTTRLRGGKRTDGSRHGQATVEMALVLPILLILMISVIEFGRLFLIQHAVTNASREGGRVATLPWKSESDVSMAVRSVLSRSGLDEGNSTISIVGIRAPAGWPVTVTVTYPCRSMALGAVLALVPGPTPDLSEITITASSNMTKE